MKEIETLIHVLAIHPAAEGHIKARVTIRLGSPQPGDRVWFEGVDRVRRELDVVSVDRSNRMSTMQFSGADADIAGLFRGTYIYACGTDD